MIELNLLPWRTDAARQLIGHRIAVMLAALIISLSFTIPIHSLLNNAVHRHTQQLQTLELQLHTVQNKLEKLRHMYPTTQYQSPEVDLEMIDHHQQGVLQFLQQLSEFIPSSVRLEQVKFEKNAWIVAGVAANIPAILQFNEHLAVRKTSDLPRPNVVDIKAIEPVFHFQLRISPANE
jgi:Tfp pilus assembly protein PilN